MVFAIGFTASILVQNKFDFLCESYDILQSPGHVLTGQDCYNTATYKQIFRGLYVGKYSPSWGEVEISANVIWGEKYEKWKRKRVKM